MTKSKDLTAGPLTVKYVEDSGFERVVQATFVQYCPPSFDTPPCLTAFGVPTGDEHDMMQFHDSTVYVMNEAGATVGVYRLGLPTRVGVNRDT